MPDMNRNVLIFGGSRNIGYFSGLRLLSLGATVTFSLRSPAVFDKDEKIQGYVKSGKARLVKGDALVQADVQRSWDEASKERPVDILLFTVGGVPSFHPLKGFVITPPNLVTQCMLNVLCTMPTADPQPKFVAITSMGITRASHEAMPLPMRALYNIALGPPHKDKLGAECAIAYCAGWNWNTKDDGEPEEDIMGPGDWKKRAGLPAPGTLKRILVIRPALLTDGECVADKNEAKGKGKEKAPYRVDEKELRGWTVSRKDVAHFVVDAAVNRWDDYENKAIYIAY